jgi:hypothetical protein
MESKSSPVEAVIFSSLGLQLLIETLDPGGHETKFYYVPPANSAGRTCQECEDPAMFILYDKDHDGLKSVNSFCRNHSIDSFFEILNSKKSA